VPRNDSDPSIDSSPSGGGGIGEADDGGGRAPNLTDSHLQPRPDPAGTANFRSAVLLGSDHTELEEIAIQAITQNLAIGISRGRFPKGYPHVDPNEDAAYAATDGTTTILAVADGHHGFNAAQAAIAAIAEVAPPSIEEDPETVVRTLGEAAIRAVAATVPGLPGPRKSSRTSLTICVLRNGSLATLTIGDTACFLATRRRARQIGTTTDFLGPNTTAEALLLETTVVQPEAAVVVTTDGFLDFASGVEGTLRTTSNLSANEGVEELLSAAFSGGAGDNIAAAVFRPT